MCFCRRMMCMNVVLFGILLNTIHYSSGERRITNGTTVVTAKRYMAYLIKAPGSPQNYDEWLCGGVIVSPLFIVTSAACIEDVQHMYAIAGYRKYVRSEEIESNDCTRATKKKVVFTCVPKAYELHYDKVEKWSYIDIGVVKVESPYSFTDPTYERICSYTPDLLRINYESKYQEPGLDAMVLGWGHAILWRKPEDEKDYNQPLLQYAPVLLTDKVECKNAYNQTSQMAKIIDKYMICTNRPGNIDEAGDLIRKTKPVADGCNVKRNENIEMLEECDVNTRKKLNANETGSTSRRYGICQNDHGGPLVTWVGTHEILIGVASVFRVTEDSQCEGPYLFTSTQCNSAFLDCTINGQHSTLRHNICDKPPKERGFDFIRRTISWRNHPDGPAENEKILFRPYLPIRKGHEP